MVGGELIWGLGGGGGEAKKVLGNQKFKVLRESDVTFRHRILLNLDSNVSQPQANFIL